MDPFVIGPQDSQLVLLAAATISATANEASLDLANGSTVTPNFAPGDGGIPMQIFMPITSVKLTAGNETYAFKVQDSPDNATWTDRSPTWGNPTFAAPTDSFPAVDGAGGLIVSGAFIRARYVRIVATLGGTAPSIVLGNVYLQPSTNSVG